MIKEDKSMKEIHGIMEKLSKKRSGMGPEEVIKDIKMGSELLKKKHNIVLKSPVSIRQILLQSASPLLRGR
jgi:hypothetical protein